MESTLKLKGSVVRYGDAARPRIHRGLHRDRPRLLDRSRTAEPPLFRGSRPRANFAGDQAALDVSVYAL